MFQLSQYPVEQISQNFQKRFNGFKEEFYKLKYCSTVVYMVPRA